MAIQFITFRGGLYARHRKIVQKRRRAKERLIVSKSTASLVFPETNQIERSYNVSTMKLLKMALMLRFKMV